MSVSAPGGKTYPWLVADIGGTNARFGWVQDDSLVATHVRKLPVKAYAGPSDAVNVYLAEISTLMGSAYEAPHKAAFAVATAVTGDEIAFTNSEWRFSRRAVQGDLHLDTLLVLNDFEALALSLPLLRESQVRAHGPMPTANGTLAVIGPGTGLGVAGMVQTRGQWLALPGEGGHATLAAHDDFEADLLRILRRSFAHVSAERVLSGIGLPLLHSAVASMLGRVPETLDAKAIVERALAGDDACDRTIDLFCGFLGGFAGNVALTLGARGGVYIGGGIVPRLGERFFNSKFRERFEAKGRLTDYLKSIPTAVITDTQAALGGAALAIERAATGADAFAAFR